MSDSLDEILSSIGHGKFQYLIFFTCSSWGIFGSMHLMLTAFLVPQSTDFECELSSLPEVNWTLEEKRNFSFPKSGDGGFSKCLRYDINFSDFEGLSFDAAAEKQSAVLPMPLQKCRAWEFDTSLMNSSVISEWNLVCDRFYLRSLVQSVFMGGVFVAALVGGFLADRYGRIRLISWGFVLYILSGITTGFSTTFEFFLVTRFLVALSGNFVYLTSYILMLEWCHPRQRSIMGLVFSVPFAIGYMTLPFAAYFAKNWRTLLKMISVFTLPLVVNILLMVESPRWLIQNKKFGQAVSVINYARKINSLPELKDEDLTDFFSPYQTHEFEGSHRNSSGGNWGPSGEGETMTKGKIKQRCPYSCSSKLIAYSVVLMLNWFVCNLVYYGLSLGTGNLGINPFLYMFLGGLMEIPCYTLVVPFILKYGRRVPLISFLGVTGVSVASSLALPTDSIQWGIVCLNMFAKLNITAAFQLLFLYSSEILPTNVRTLGVGVISMFGRLGAILCPIITDVLGQYNWRFMPIIFGCCCLAATLASLLLPETFEKSLPDTAEDVEKWNKMEKA